MILWSTIYWLSLTIYWLSISIHCSSIVHWLWSQIYRLLVLFKIGFETKKYHFCVLLAWTVTVAIFHPIYEKLIKTIQNVPKSVDNHKEPGLAGYRFGIILETETWVFRPSCLSLSDSDFFEFSRTFFIGIVKKKGIIRGAELCYFTY